MKIVALVPARSGSKGVPNKNIKELHGNPLISYSIKAAINCAEIEQTYLSSDNPDYLRLGEKYGAVPYLRSAELSSDTTSMKDVVKDFIMTLKMKKQDCDAVIVLYPTHPMRIARNLTDIIKAFKNQGKNTPLIGLKPPATHPYQCYHRAKNGQIENVMGINTQKLYRRQQYPEYYQICYWACIIPALIIDKLDSQLLCPETYGYILPDEIPYVNIDTFADFQYAEYLIKQLEHTNS